MGYLIVGLGRRGLLHLRAFNRHAGKRLSVYVYDSGYDCSIGSRHDSHSQAIGDGKTASGIIALRHRSDIRQLRGVTLAIVATPSHTHFTVLQELLPMDCKILLEKPSVASIAELASIRQLSAVLRRRIFVGYSERVNPVVRQARETIIALVAHRAVRSMVFERARPRAQAALGAIPCLELLVHDLDFVLNDLFPRSRLTTLKVVHGAARCHVVGSICHVDIVLASWWTDGASVSRVEVEQDGGQSTMFDLSTGGDEGRLLALARQLDRVESASFSGDLDRDLRVMEVVLRGA